jgi:hypothetical protein
MIPTIKFTSKEIAQDVADPSTVLNAYNLFKANGCLLLEKVFSSAYIKDLYSSFMERYNHYFYDKEYCDALKIGDKRFQITIEVKPPFNDPLLYAHPLIYPLIKMIFLNQQFKLGSFGAVISLPGAKQQHIHRDNPSLFEDEKVYGLLPSFAITMSVPMVDLNEFSGTTRLWIGSHLIPDWDLYIKLKFESEKLPYEDPYLSVGDCLLMDYRIQHAGLANQSEYVRPILYNSYFCPWYKDWINFDKQYPVLISETEYKNVPPKFKQLFMDAKIV